MKILDIDLDFFLQKKAHSTVTSKRRLNKNEYKCWEKEDAIRFLEENCGLSKSKKIPGRYFIHHVEVFHFLKEIQKTYNFNVRFSIDHVDAHADLGLGDASYNYISAEILHMPLAERHEIKQFNGWYGLSSGNYLAFAIACRWISELKYINNKDWFNDLQSFHFRDLNPESKIIELKKYHDEDIQKMINNGDFYSKALTIKPLELEPAIPFEKIEYENFRNEETYDYILLTQSPGFTPKTADALIEVIKEYMLII